MNHLQATPATLPNRADLQPLVVNLKTASRLLGVCERTLHDLKQSGEIPHLRIGHRVLFSVESLHKWIEQQERGGNIK